MSVPWIDYQAVKAAVGMEAVLAAYGIHLGRQVGAQFRGCCPLPQHGSPRSHQSFLVHTRKEVWICHSQSCVAQRGGQAGGNVLDFVAAMEQCSIAEAAHQLWRMAKGTGFKKKEGGGRMALGWAAGVTESQNRPLGFALHPVDSRHAYLRQRGIERSTAEYFQVGYYSGTGLMQGRIVFPLHDEQGRLVGYAGRAIQADALRYRFPAGLRKSLLLFNLHRVQPSGAQTVIVVEGFFDCLRVHQAGFPAVVALMGSSAAAPQQALLRHYFQEAVVMLDGDETGRRASQRIISQLGHAIALRLAEVPHGRQPDELTDSAIRQIIQTALPAKP